MATASSPTAVFYITGEGLRLARSIAASFKEAECFTEAESFRFSAAEVRSHWKKGGRLIFVMASGIVVRTIAPLLRDKGSDPAVLVVDEKGRHIVSLLGGHGGHANELARKIAEVTGGEAVITTASDVNDLPAIDLWAEEQGLVAENRKAFAKAGTTLVDRRSVRVSSEIALPMPSVFIKEDDPAHADILITNRLQAREQHRVGPLILRPHNLVAGIGCNSGTNAGEITGAVKETLEEAGLSFLSLSVVATIDKKAEEPGLVDFARSHGLPIVAYSAGELNTVKGVSPSPAARKATGAQAVADPAAILGSKGGTLLVEKRKIGNVTVAIAQTPDPGPVGRCTAGTSGRRSRGRIYVVGTGPGGADYLTPRASNVIRQVDAVVGYGPYLDLVRPMIVGKEVVSTGMAQEIDRCRRAIEMAIAGKQVAVISGGDPGIYAMAGLVLELLREKAEVSFSSEDVEIVPGVSALNACAARLGAPLMHDFAAISLSDRLTPWQMIEARIEAAAAADFVIALYNPKSRGRRTHIEKACAVIMKHRAPETPVGIVRAAMREDEAITVTDLAHVPFDVIDMQTTVIVGNSRTETWNGFMITPRGYEQKKEWSKG